MNRCLVVISFHLLLGHVTAQESRFLLHDIGDANDGKPINALLQDRECMLWLGTDRGLFRYDGNTVHKVAISGADTTIRVTSLFEDASRRLWVGTASGEIFILDASRKPQPFNIDEGHPGKPVTSICQDTYGNLWLATYGEGAYVYSGNRLYNFNVDDGLSGDELYAMACTPDGDVWLGTDDGITICSFVKEKKHIRTLGLKDGLPDQIVTALHADTKGNVWIGTFENGVVFYDTGNKMIIRPFDEVVRDEITSFTIFDETEIWFGTHASGVWRYSPGDAFPRRIENLQMYQDLQVEALLTDVEGNIWIGTDEGMLLSAFRPFEWLETEVAEIQALFCDHADRVWVGTKDGLYTLEEQPSAVTKVVPVAPQFRFNVTDIFEDRFHNLWIGTIDKGLFVYNPDKDRVKHVGTLVEKGGYTIMSMDATREDIWIATLDGVISYPASRNIMEERDNGFHLLVDPWESSLHFVYQVFVDSKERVWFATSGNGVYCKDGTEIHHYTGSDSLELESVYSVCEDQRGYIWFNSPAIGLIEFDGQTFKTVGLDEGLGGLSLGSIITAGTGDLLITHDHGIDLMEPDRRHFMYFNEEIGLKKIEPGFNTAAVDSKGHVYTSGKNLIVKYYATEYRQSIHPRTQLTRVSVFNQPVDHATVSRFSYAQNFISFDYIGLWYTSPASVKYQYKLEGYDLQWKESRDNVASYSDLRPGTYTFLVKASENNFFLDEPASSYTFTIGKPFWLQGWFIVLMTVAGIAALYWLIKSREKRSERQALLKKEMIESQLTALKAQINPHFLFNSFNTLITIIDENAMHPDVAIEYVEKLSDFYRSILQYREQETISLEEEWTLVQNFIYLLEKRYGQNLRLHMDPPPKDAFILPMTLQMLVENAVKHNVISERYPLDLYISVEDDQYVTVKNNVQPKSKAEPSTRFGLQSIIKRYQLLSDLKVIVEKDPKMFVVHIPIIKKSGA